MFDDTEFIAEGDKEFAIAFSLVERKDENTGEVIAGLFGFWEVAGDVVLIIFYFAENIEEENAHIPLQIFVIQE